MFILEIMLEKFGLCCKFDMELWFLLFKGKRISLFFMLLGVFCLYVKLNFINVFKI